MDKKVRVLLVEDSLGDIRLISDMIESSGKQKFEFSHNIKLSSALARLATREYDVILLELNLPDSKGLDTLRIFRSKFKNIPIVVLTDSYSAELELKAVREGAQDLLVKGHFEDNLLIKTLLYAVQRKEYEAALSESENRFRTMADIAPVLIWMSDADKQYNYFNITWLHFRGRKLEQESGKGWTEGIHPEDFQNWSNVFTKSFDAHEKFYIEYRLRRADGEYRWLYDSGAPRFSSDGVFLGFIGSCVDITERKKAEEELEISNAKFQGLIKSAMDAIISVDSSQKIILFNNAAEMMFKYPASQAIGMNINSFVPASFREKHKNHIRNFGNTHVSTRSMGKLGTLTALRADGVEFPIEASISQVEVAGEKIYTVIIRDISQRHIKEKSELPHKAV